MKNCNDCIKNNRKPNAVGCLECSQHKNKSIMNYIRTKDGNIYEYVKQRIHPSQYTKFGLYRHSLNSKYEQIIAEADTIEELCDEFVVVSKTNHFHTLYATDTYSLTKVACDISNMRDRYDIYGAIWTNKGLIYVAKMNEKGELELI